MPTTLRSFSKINLGLAIGPVRPDGFHALTTCYQTLEAHDLVTVAARPAAETSIRITSNDPGVPVDRHNTAWKIVQLALDARALSADVEIHIEKRLPVQGGLGAGSGNAVAALLALDCELAEHGMAPMTGPERLEIAARVGSDVPLFLVGGAVLGVGHGEEVYPLPDFPAVECVLALPQMGVSTPQAFRDWDELQSTGQRAQPSEPESESVVAEGPMAVRGKPGTAAALTRADGSDTLTRLSRALVSAFCPGLPVDASAGTGTHSSGVFAAGADLAGKTGSLPCLVGGVLNPLLALVRTGIENDFEGVVFRQYPSLGTIKRILADSVNPEERALHAALSGSGSALFGLYKTAAAAEAAQARLSASGIRSLRTKTLPRTAYWGQAGSGREENGRG